MTFDELLQKLDPVWEGRTGTSLVSYHSGDSEPYDGLTAFVLAEIEETFDEDAGTEEQVSRAAAAIEMARDDLEALINALEA